MGWGVYKRRAREMKEEKKVIVPTINVNHNENDMGLHISVNLSGAAKDTVDLEMGKEGLCVKAEGEDFRYETCFMLAHRVKAEEAKAKFEAGLMTIQVPFEETMRGHKVAIE
jgi:HSP20 family molecular chaperone IbpA